MADLRDLQSWFESAGFRNYCFISYPHTGETEMTEFAQKIRDKLEEELSYRVSKPSVFLDNTQIRPGEDWQFRLYENLAASVVMVAVVAPI
jgi:hypothetical protein